MGALNDKKDNAVYKFCAVQFNEKSHPYHYLTGKHKVKIGDLVVVPVGNDGEERTAKVVSVFECNKASAPFPVEKVKTIKGLSKEVNFKNRLLKFFLIVDIIFAISTIVFTAIIPPVGLVGLAVTIFYSLIIVSINKSIHGKRPVIDIFREGEKRCKKCGYTFPKKLYYSCPQCAKEARNTALSYEDIMRAKLKRDIRKAAFWAAMDELFEPTAPLKPKETDVWTKMESEGEWIDHNSEGHDLENGYCIDCDSDFEDML